MEAQTEWTIFDERWWLLPLALRVIIVSAIIVAGALNGLQVDRLAVLLAVLVVLNTLLSWWTRVRLTADGVEVRRLRTRLYRWVDLESVSTTRGWHGGLVLTDRRDGHAPVAVLPFPRRTFRPADDPTMTDAVLEIRSRIEDAQLSRS